MKVDEIEKIIQTIYCKVLSNLESESISTLSDESHCFFDHPISFIEKHDMCIVKHLSVQQLALIAQLQFNDDVEQKIIDFLLKGKKVYVLENDIEKYIKNRKSKYYLWKQLVEIKSTCENYGIVFTDEQFVLDLMASFPKEATKITTKPVYVTETLLKKHHKSKSLNKILKNSYKLTPLAQDYALENGLNL